MNRVKRNSGFSLIELAVAITIIGLLIAGVMKGSSLIEDAKVSNAITLAHDVSVAVNSFRQQYHLLPGDMTIDAVNPEFPSLRIECRTGANIGNNNGLIEVIESPCVPEILFLAGMAKVDQENGWEVFKTYYGQAIVKASRTVPYLAANIAAGTFPATHVVEFQNVPCDAVKAIDRKIDNDILTSGKAVADLTVVFDPANPTTCVSGTIIPAYAVSL